MISIQISAQTRDTLADSTAATGGQLDQKYMCLGRRTHAVSGALPHATPSATCRLQASPPSRTGLSGQLTCFATWSFLPSSSCRRPSTSFSCASARSRSCCRASRLDLHTTQTSPPRYTVWSVCARLMSAPSLGDQIRTKMPVRVHGRQWRLVTLQAIGKPCCGKTPGGQLLPPRAVWRACSPVCGQVRCAGGALELLQLLEQVGVEPCLNLLHLTLGLHTAQPSTAQHSRPHSMYTSQHASIAHHQCRHTTTSTTTLDHAVDANNDMHKSSAAG